MGYHKDLEKNITSAYYKEIIYGLTIFLLLIGTCASLLLVQTANTKRDLKANEKAVAPTVGNVLSLNEDIKAKVQNVDASEEVKNFILNATTIQSMDIKDPDITAKDVLHAYGIEDSKMVDAVLDYISGKTDSVNSEITEQDVIDFLSSQNIGNYEEVKQSIESIYSGLYNDDNFVKILKSLESMGITNPDWSNYSATYENRVVYEISVSIYTYYLIIELEEGRIVDWELVNG